MKWKVQVQGKKVKIKGKEWKVWRKGPGKHKGKEEKDQGMEGKDQGMEEKNEEWGSSDILIVCTPWAGNGPTYDEGRSTKYKVQIQVLWEYYSQRTNKGSLGVLPQTLLNNK